MNNFEAWEIVAIREDLLARKIRTATDKLRLDKMNERCLDFGLATMRDHGAALDNSYTFHPSERYNRLKKILENERS